jgi:periplasmic divalent cation tolerance protein
VAVLVSSVPSDVVAVQIARTLVEEGLAACVTRLPGATSIYRWEGVLEESSEVILLAKVSAETTVRATQRIRELHPFQCPEILALPATFGFEPYLRWVEESCTRNDGHSAEAPPPHPV